MDNYTHHMDSNYIPSETWERHKKFWMDYYAALEPQHRIFSSLGIPLKYSGYFAMIPENLDIEAHIEKFPLTNYKFIQDNAGFIRSVNSQGSVGAVFDKDRLIYIIGLISSIPARNKDSITDDGFVQINSTLIRNTFKDYLSYLDYLILTGILCTDGQYIQGKKSKGYKFTKRYAKGHLVRYDYPTFQACDKRESIHAEMYSDEENTFVYNTVQDYVYLNHWYYTKLLQIDERKASKYAYHIMCHKLANGISTWEINKDKSTTYRIVRKNPINQYHAALYNINSIAIGNYKVSIDTNVHRLHSVITNLQKEYRRFLRYNGQRLVNVDISNSQPYIICLLLNPLFWDDTSDIPLNIRKLHPSIQSRFSEHHVREIYDRISSIQNSEEIRSYIQITAQGRIYEYLQNVINNQQNTNLERKDIKTIILTTLFSKNRYMPSFKLYFKSCFPQIYKLIELIKREDHTALAILLQNIESEIVLHRCCLKIWENGKHEVPVFTIHDSVCTTVENVQFIVDCLTEILTEYIGVTPHLKIED